MSASTRPAARPSRFRRTLAGGSVLGVGLLAAATAGAPAALADPEVTTDPATATDASTAEPAPEPLNEDPAVAAGERLVVVDGEADAGAVPEVDDYSDITPIEPMFGLGKFPFNDFGTTTTLSVESTGDVPDDLSLAGARFDLTQIVEADDGTKVGIPAGVCVADDTGTCTISADIDDSEQPEVLPEGPSVTVPMGTYVVTQSAAPVGLAPVAGRAAVLDVCSAFNGFTDSCGDGAPTALAVENGSLFATEVDVQVQDVETDLPVSGAGYTLSGPDYVHTAVEDGGTGGEVPIFPLPGPPFVVPLGVAAGESAVPAGVTRTADPSDENGLITFEGYFPPGHYTVDPDPAVAPVANYEPASSEDLDIDDTDPATARRLYTVTAHLSPVKPDSTGGNDDGTGGGGPVTGGPTTGGPTTGGPTTGGPVTGGPGSTGGTTGTRTGTTTTGGTTSRGTQATTADEPVVDTAPVPVTPPSSARPSGPTASSSSSAPQEEPDPTALETESSSIPAAGVIGFGVLFVAVVVVAIGVLRRRARARG